LPLGIFIALAGVLYVGLSLDPKELPSALLDKPLPGFDLAPLEPGQPNAAFSRSCRWSGVGDQYLCLLVCALSGRNADPGQAGSRMEMLRLIGLVYKDQNALAKRFLADYGNPFSQIGIDPQGRAGIDFGLDGVPETYAVNGQGIIWRSSMSGH